ncbi:MAG: hypothetical protein AAFO91_10155, partial [Bacteroidota bacterium]
AVYQDEHWRSPKVQTKGGNHKHHTNGPGGPTFGPSTTTVQSREYLVVRPFLLYHSVLLLSTFYYVLLLTLNQKSHAKMAKIAVATDVLQSAATLQNELFVDRKSRFFSQKCRAVLTVQVRETTTKQVFLSFGSSIRTTGAFWLN